MPDSFKHTVSTLGGGQANFQQCWYASYKMLHSFHKRSTGSIDDKLAPVINLPDAKENGLVDKDFKKASDALGTAAWSGTKYKAEPGFFDVGLTDGCEAFLELLKVGPLWVSRYVEKGSYHIVLATGYNDDGKGYIIYNNPFPGPSNAVEVTTMTANVFVKHITDAMGSIQGFR